MDRIAGSPETGSPKTGSSKTGSPKTGVAGPEVGPECVLFDYDYTLADSSEGIVEAVNHALRAMGLAPAGDAAIRRTIGLSLPAIYQALTAREEADEAERFRTLFIERADEIMNERTFVFEGVEDVVARLRERGLRLGIVSTKFRTRIEAVLRREGLRQHFEVIVGGEDVAVHKPHPEALVAAVSRMGSTAARTLYVGDSLSDGEAARRAGVRFVGITTGVTASAELETVGPFRILGSLSELESVL